MISNLTLFIKRNHNYFDHRYPSYSDHGKGVKHYRKFSGKQTSYPKIIQVWIKGPRSVKLDIGYLRPNLTTKECKKV